MHTLYECLGRIVYVYFIFICHVWLVFGVIKSSLQLLLKNRNYSWVNIIVKWYCAGNKVPAQFYSYRFIYLFGDSYIYLYIIKWNIFLIIIVYFHNFRVSYELQRASKWLPECWFYVRPKHCPFTTSYRPRIWEKIQFVFSRPTIRSRNSSVASPISTINQDAAHSHALAMSICARVSTMIHISSTRNFDVSHFA